MDKFTQEYANMIDNVQQRLITESAMEQPGGFRYFKFDGIVFEAESGKTVAAKVPYVAKISETEAGYFDEETLMEYILDKISQFVGWSIMDPGSPTELDEAQVEALDSSAEIVEI